MPEPLRLVAGTAAPLPLENVDTDMIWPGSTGASVRRGEQARQAFHHLRFAPDGSERADFILNRAPWREARILIAGDNFGCGSSRETAVWSLYEWGLRCIIAPGFGDIFYNNCCLNGLLPVRLTRNQADLLAARATDPATATMTVDLETCTVSSGDLQFPFEIEAGRREALLHGHDAISQTLGLMDEVDAFGRHYAQAFAWMEDLPTGPWRDSPGDRS